VVEIVAARQAPGCKEALKRVGLEKILEAVFAPLRLASLARRGDKLVVTLLYQPDEFTKKRFKLRFVERLEDDRLVARGKGDANVEIVGECRGGELVLAVSVHGRVEKLIDEDRAAKNLEHVIEELLPAPMPPMAPPVQTPSLKPLALSTAGTESCVVRLLSGGLVYDESLSQAIKTHYHSEANTAGRVVEEGREMQELIDTRRYLDGFDIRYTIGADIVEVVRMNGKYGVCIYTARGVECGGGALEKAVRELCSAGEPIDYMVIELPRG